MSYSRLLLGEVAHFARGNRGWMVWNLLLAAVPVGLGAILAAAPGRKRLLWWAGAVLFVLFLPNAPYLLTDLIHVPEAIAGVRMRGTVLVGILPSYVVLAAAGLVLYSVALALAGRVIDEAGWERWHEPAIVVLHLLSAVGVVLGRIGRLNSWNTVLSPETTVNGTVDALTWSWAPAAIGVLFITLWASHTVLTAAGRGLVRSASVLRPV